MWEGLSEEQVNASRNNSLGVKEKGYWIEKCSLPTAQAVKGAHRVSLLVCLVAILGHLLSLRGPGEG